jgi:DNA primase
VVDYTFATVGSGLDLTRVSDPSKARDRLYPVVDGITDVVRRAHYLQKLARMLGVSDSSLEASMRKRAKTPGKREANATSAAPKPADNLFKSAAEEYCLTLLLRCPELRATGKDLEPDYFRNSENREIFVAWRDDSDGSFDGVKKTLDASIHDHLTDLAGKNIQTTGIEKKYANCVLRLREEFLRNLERQREALLTGEADSGAELARSKEVSAELKQVFEMKARREQGLRS